MIMIYIIFCLLLIFVIESCETLKCYSCREKKECGKTFSSNSIDNQIVHGNDLYDSCSITVNTNGLINRDIIPAHTCQSSSYQFCCNQDLCNSLPSLPLPTFTTLKCAIGICQMNDDQCNNSIVYLSSATESCVRMHRESVYMSYQMGCSPNKTTITSSANESTTQNQFCCNSPVCNQQLLLSGAGIRCYTCDSRITGLESCSILNTSSSYVYNSESSSRTESCAMIIGLTGKNLMTGDNYPAFTIRTFIDNCVNQSLGNVTYGGASFQGRIDCCSTSLCNTHPLYTNLTLQTRKVKRNLHGFNMIVFIIVTYLGLVFILIGISISIYRFHLKKSHDHYIPSVRSDGETVLFLPPR